MKKGKDKMTSKAASRIQSYPDRTKKNQGFKSRAQNALVSYNCYTSLAFFE